MIIFKNKHITVFQSQIFKMNSTVVVTNDIVLVVDPGYLPDEVDEIRHYVNKIKQDRTVCLLFTHSDFDHIAGDGAFPEAKKIASKEFVESSFKDKQIQDIKLFDDELYIKRSFKMEYPKIDYAIENDGEELTIGKTVITFFHAFGHTNDSLMAVIDQVNLLIAGDYLSDIEFPFIYHSFHDYEKALDTFKRVLSNKKHVVLVPGHGNATDEICEIEKRIKDSKDYLQLIKKEVSNEEFKRYLNDKKYDFFTNLNKRHQENLMLWKEQEK